MKKLLSVFVIIATIVSVFSACDSTSNAKIKIGFAAPEATHGWVAGVSYYAEKYCKEHRIEYKLTTSADAEEMEKNLDKLAEWGADAVVIWPQWSGMEKEVNKLIGKGVPVVSFDIDIESENVYKVMGNNYDLGYQCAKYITEKVGDSASIAVMDVPSVGSVSQLRKQGFYDYLKEIGYDSSNVFEVSEAAFNREDGYNDMKKVLSEHKKIDAVFSMDDETSIGIVKAITESGRTDIKAVTGGGGMQEYFNMIADKNYASLGLVSALYSPSMIEDAIGTAVKLSKDESAMKLIIIPTTVVTSENVKDYLDSQNTVY